MRTLKWVVRKAQLVHVEGYSEGAAQQIVEQEQLAEASAKAAESCTPSASQEDKDAALFKAFKDAGGEVIAGKIKANGALSRLSKKDGRKRQTLQPIILRAAAREATDSPFSHIARHLKGKG